MDYTTNDFRLDLRKCTAPPGYIWVNSGYSTCAPKIDTVTGIKGCFSPPFAAGDTELTFMLESNHHLIPDNGSRGKDDCGLLLSGMEWRPEMIVRTGTYHYRIDRKLHSFYVNSKLIPLTGKAGFLTEISVENRSHLDIELAVHPILSAGHPSYIELEQWNFMPPASSDSEALPVDDHTWQNEQVKILLLSDVSMPVHFSPGDTSTFRFAVIFTRPGESATVAPDLNKLKTKTLNCWYNKINLANRTLPKLESNIPGLEAYYRRSLISGLVCLWNNNDYITDPFPATSGMDGGSICCYPWDVAGYSAETLVMLLGEKSKDFLSAMLHSGIESHISMSLSGTGLGWCSYSYSMWSIIHLFWTILTMTGTGFELFDDVLALFKKEELRLEEFDHLKNYGRQHNLLEMRSCGYEYFVPSPNAERAWCYERMADVANALGRTDCTSYYPKAVSIKRSIIEKLWDEDKGWFCCIHPDGHSELVYSIQIYDVMRMGICDSVMEQRLTAHLQDGTFLGKYGVSSISAEDPVHYELNDTDWSGGGCYTGDGPVLAETLWTHGYSRLAFDVLKRHLWMGETLPYFPQEHYCDKPAMPPGKRANIIAGVAGMQSILFGMFGLKCELDGRLVIDPHPPEDGYVQVTDLKYGTMLIDIYIKGRDMKISADHAVLYQGAVKKIELKDRILSDPTHKEA